MEAQMDENDLFVDIDDAKKHRENLERIHKLEHERELKDSYREEPKFILQNKQPTPNQYLTKTINNDVILNSYAPPIKINHRGNVKGRHFNKTATKMDKVIELFNQGLGTRKIAGELHLAKHTVINIIREHKGALIEAEKILSNQRKIKKSTNNIVKALKCLVAADKKSPHTATELYKLSIVILNKYLKNKTAETINLLIGKDTFKIDDLLDAIETIIARETLKLNDDFIEIAPDTFRLKRTEYQDEDRICKYMQTENGEWLYCSNGTVWASGTIGKNQCRGLNNNCHQYTPKTPKFPQTDSKISP
jgi:predicted transcriptional regulator